MIPLRDDLPTTSPPVVTWMLIGLCVFVFLGQIGLSPRGEELFAYRYGVVPAVLFGQAALPVSAAAITPAWTVLTSQFLHGGVMHLAGNMLYLWVFGDNVEDVLGSFRFLLFYLICGTAAALTQSLADPASTVPMIGASGAISGVLGAYILLFPAARITVLVPIGFYLLTPRWPAGLVLGLWFATQVMSSLLAAPGTPGVAWLAHIGGFLTGAALVLLFRPT